MSDNANTDGRTHYAECWRDHLDCAVAKVEELQRATPSEPMADAEPVAWAWRTVRGGKAMHGWALGHIEPTPENCHLKEGDTLEKRPLVFAARSGQPVDMLLFCPRCGMQHVDAEEWEDHPHDINHEQRRSWDNPPHRSHLCHGCGHIWRPADVPTNGVAAIKTRGQKDGSATPSPRSEPAAEQAGRPVTDAERRIRRYIEIEQNESQWEKRFRWLADAVLYYRVRTEKPLAWCVHNYGEDVPILYGENAIVAIDEKLAAPPSPRSEPATEQAGGAVTKGLRDWLESRKNDRAGPCREDTTGDWWRGYNTANDQWCEELRKQIAALESFAATRAPSGDEQMARDAVPFDRCPQCDRELNDLLTWRDARRYRWVREQPYMGDPPEKLDAAIDAALAAQEQKEGKL